VIVKLGLRARLKRICSGFESGAGLAELGPPAMRNLGVARVASGAAISNWFPNRRRTGMMADGCTAAAVDAGSGLGLSRMMAGRLV